MPRHGGASQYHAGALCERTRKSRKQRGRKNQSRKDKAAYEKTRREVSWA